MKSLCYLALALMAHAGLAGATADLPARPRFGANVHVISPRMPLVDIQKLVDDIATRQVNNQFGDARDALLFEPGVYGSPDHPLHIKVGFYTSVAGLGARPTDTVIHGLIQVRNRCSKDGCLALDNFWRSVSNLSLEIASTAQGCGEAEIWAVSQAAPARRLKVSGGSFLLADLCTSPSYASGGFIADSQFDGEIQNSGQQQFLVRNSQMVRWTGGVWNQVFSGVMGQLPVCEAGASCPYVTLPASPVVREAPYLYLEAGQYRVFRPAVRTDARGISWKGGREEGSARPLSNFYIATPDSGAKGINAALRAGQDLLLTPGVYHLSQTLVVVRAGTLVLGLGFPTLIPEQGFPAMRVVPANGVSIAGVLFEAGPVTSPHLLQIGDTPASGDASDPTTLHDVFFRIGGAHAGGADISLIVNSGHAILDHIWAWRADHGEGVGWLRNPATTGLVVHADHVTAYGLFVEHFQGHEVLWDGEDGKVIFFQNEMPYDVPDQAAWRAAPGHDGFAAFKVADTVQRFEGYGWGSYSYFNQGIAVFAERAFEMPASLPKGSLTGAFTIFLNTTASGGIRHVVNDRGAMSDRNMPDVAVRVSSYPP